MNITWTFPEWTGTSDAGNGPGNCANESSGKQDYPFPSACPSKTVSKIATSEAKPCGEWQVARGTAKRSEEHTSELQSLLRHSYAVFCLKKTTQQTNTNNKPHKT